MAYTLITGSTGGIGKEFAHIYAKKNCNLILTGRNQQKLDKLSDKLSLINPNIIIKTLAVDLSNENSLYNMINQMQTTGIKLERLVNVAGIDTQMALANYSMLKIQAQTRVNMESAVKLTHFALNNRKGHLEILTVSSIVATLPIPFFALYSASKSFLVHFYKALKVELKGTDTFISVLMPGSVPTRDDIIEDIKNQGFLANLAKKPANYVAKVGASGLAKNKTIIVPGFANKLLYAFNKLVPYNITSNLIRKKWSSKTKDNF